MTVNQSVCLVKKIQCRIIVRKNNKNVALWNAEITKGLFKFNRATLKLSVFDLLNQNIGISRNANLNYIEDASYKVLNRFYMASFTYNLRKAGNTGPNINVRIN